MKVSIQDTRTSARVRSFCLCDFFLSVSPLLLSDAASVGRGRETGCISAAAAASTLLITTSSHLASVAMELNLCQPVLPNSGI